MFMHFTLFLFPPIEQYCIIYFTEIVRSPSLKQLTTIIKAPKHS